MTADSPEVAVIGAGPAGLMAAEVLAQARCRVTVLDAMPSPGRKLLMAGRGGLNLTHSEPLEAFVGRYGNAAGWLRPHVEAFPPSALIAWCEGLGIATFVGSSGRVFPKGLKASPLLRAWLRRLANLGVTLRLRHRWTGWTADGALAFSTPTGPLEMRPAATVLALGGKSWPRLGSDGAWSEILADQGIAVTPLTPANCGVEIAWSSVHRERFAGAPLKRIALEVDGVRARGEAVVTSYGLEGGAVYALGPVLRRELQFGGTASLIVDLRPDLDEPAIAQRLAGARAKQSLSNRLRTALALEPVAISLLREAVRELPAEPAELAALVKRCPLQATGLRGFERAISTAGGIAREELDRHMMLHRLPGVFAAGEMLDWEAPTGGYLLQACFATGAAAARGALCWLGRDTSR